MHKQPVKDRKAALGAGQFSACSKSAATPPMSLSGCAVHRYMDVQKWAEEAAEAGAVVFLAVHEQCVADGGLQEALTNLGVPHTGTSGQAALTVYDKVGPDLRLTSKARCRKACGFWGSIRPKVCVQRCHAVAIYCLV